MDTTTTRAALRYAAAHLVGRAEAAEAEGDPHDVAGDYREAARRIRESAEGDPRNPHYIAAGLRDDAAVYDDDARHADAQAAGPVSAAAAASLRAVAVGHRKRAATARAVADVLDTRDTPPAECVHDAADALQCRAEAYAGKGMGAHAARFYAAAAAVRDTLND